MPNVFFNREDYEPVFNYLYEKNKRDPSGSLVTIIEYEQIVSLLLDDPHNKKQGTKLPQIGEPSWRHKIRKVHNTI